ncbi:MAG: hypothetical protein LBI37_02780 [Puniceicoccales bacterium]|jgi:hypothetical protein|nr:hypothetical protein [Puniceicoccales bacterium]
MDNRENFMVHFDKVKYEKYNSELMPETATISSSIAGASLVRIWQILFDLLCRSDEISVADLNTLSGIIQKLFVCHTNMYSMKQLKCDEQNTDSKQSLSEDVIEDLEKQLRLL